MCDWLIVVVVPEVKSMTIDLSASRSFVLRPPSFPLAFCSSSSLLTSSSSPPSALCVLLVLFVKLSSCFRVGVGVNEGVFVSHIVWLWNVVTAWGMYDFARARCFDVDVVVAVALHRTGTAQGSNTWYRLVHAALVLGLVS